MNRNQRQTKQKRKKNNTKPHEKDFSKFFLLRSCSMNGTSAPAFVVLLQKRKQNSAPIFIYGIIHVSRYRKKLDFRFGSLTSEDVRFKKGYFYEQKRIHARQSLWDSIQGRRQVADDRDLPKREQRT
tara:strand:+ start:347 stop:727 length:381 start_codon:yes stop_codon:yes gene_type:complete